MTLLSLLLACAPDGGPGSTALSGLATDDGLYVVSVAPDPDPPVAGDAALDLDVTADDEPAEGLLLTVEPWMPSMGHGVHDAPVVEEIGDGAYRAEWVYTMPGEWEVRLDLKGPAGDDTLTLTFDVG